MSLIEEIESINNQSKEWKAKRPLLLMLLTLDKSIYNETFYK